MNQANLAKLFHNYIESYNVLTDAEHDELYKWRAVNHFQKHWNLEADEFGEMFKQAMEQSFNIVNNSIVQPANGIVFLCKQDKKTEEEVREDLESCSHQMVVISGRDRIGLIHLLQQLMKSYRMLHLANGSMIRIEDLLLCI